MNWLALIFAVLSAAAMYVAKICAQEACEPDNEPWFRVDAAQAARTISTLGIILGLSAVALLLLAWPVRAGEFSPYFNGLKSPFGADCCAEADCHFTEAEWRDGQWWAQARDGRWLAVPPAMVIHNNPSPTGEAVACDMGMPPAMFRCFVPPNMGF